MEYWMNGASEKHLILQIMLTHYSIIPAFQYSISGNDLPVCPIGSKAQSLG